MEIRKNQTEEGLEINIKVTNQDLIDTLEDAEKNNNKVVTAIAKMDDTYLEEDPSLLLLLLSSTASLKLRKRNSEMVTLEKGRQIHRENNND